MSAHAPTPAAATPHPPSMPTRSPSLGILIGGGLAVLLVILFFLAPSGDEKKQDDEPTSVATSSASQRPSTTSPSESSTLENTYEFSNSLNRKVEVYLEFHGGEMIFIPLGGRVKVTPPSGNAYIMIPGIRVKREPEPDGWFTFEPADSSATGLMIVQNIRR